MTANDTSSSPPPLEYGLSPPRRKRHIVQALVGLALLAIGYAGYRWGSYIWQQAAVMNSQRQCMNYTAPANAVVYEEDAAEATRLLSRADGTYVRYVLNRALSPDLTARKSTVAAARFPSCWTRFSSLVTLTNPRPGQSSGAILFLHERTSDAGHRRLVCVRYFPETFSFTPQFAENYNFEQMVFTPATWSSDASQSVMTSSTEVSSGFPTRPPNLRIYAGQIDPQDDSRFTIRYEAWGQSDILDGRLYNNDQVSLTPRKVPQPPP